MNASNMEEQLREFEKRWHRFELLMEFAVPAWIQHIQSKGQPTEQEISHAYEVAQKVLFEGSQAFITEKAPTGHIAELFNQLAESLAYMAFEPEGVAAFGHEWKA